MSDIEEINILLGRFQPITVGHIKCAEEALEKMHVRSVLCMIETKESKCDSKHPFPSDMLVPIYEKILDPELIAGVVLVRNANIIEVGNKLIMNKYMPVSWTCGTDRIDAYKRLVDNYADKAGLPEGFQLIEIKRDDSAPSATKAREYLLDDNKAAFARIFPEIPLKYARLNIYDKLRAQILSVMK